MGLLSREAGAQEAVKRLPQEQGQQIKGSVVPERALEVLDFWFGSLPDSSFYPEKKEDVWFSRTPEIDYHIRTFFSQEMQQAMRGELNEWRQTPKGRLALILLLDQFPRHVYRNQPQAFVTDPMARGLVSEGLQRKDDQCLYPIERAFFYLPLEHAEDVNTQALSVTKYRRLVDESPPAMRSHMQAFLHCAHLHRDQIARFGRFPHRNAILARKSTPTELIFLSQWKGTSPF